MKPRRYCFGIELMIPARNGDRLVDGIALFKGWF